MYSIDGLEFTMTCIVLIGYISGKVWMYYCIDKDTKKPNKENKSKVIRRG